MKGLPSFVALLVPLAALAVAPPAAAADLEVKDGAGDVHPVDQTTPASAPTSPVSDLADILAVKFQRETGLDFEIAYTLASVGLQLPQGQVNLRHLVCFDLQGKTFAIRLLYVFRADGSPLDVSTILYRMPGAACDVNYAPTSQQAVDVILAPESKTFTFVLSKASLSALLGVGESVKKGDRVEKIQAFSRLLSVPPGTTWTLGDAAPDAGPNPEPYLLELPVHNSDLRVVAPTASRQGVLQCSGLNRPVISIEGGSFQGIPIRIENARTGAVVPELSATVDKSAWSAKIIPRIEVPGAAGGDGNTTVTLIVKSTAASKECGEVRVFARDPADPDRVGELALEVVSAPALSVDRNTLFLHARASSQFPPPIWMNAAEQDPGGQPDYNFQLYPRGQTQVGLGSSFRFQFDAASDGVFPFDVLLDSRAVVKALLFLRSDPVPTTARFTLEMTTGGEKLAETEGVLTIPAGPGTGLGLELPVEPDVFKNTLRRAPADQPFGLTVRYDPITPVPQGVAPTGAGAGNVFFYPGKSSLELPIVETVVTKDVRLGSKGALVSLSLADPESTKLSNEARAVYFNFTLTNEGVGTDAFAIATNLTADPPANWTVHVRDAATLAGLAPGDRGTFSVLVVAPPVAAEGAEARIRVIATSQTDDASATALVTVKIAKQQEHGVVFSPPKVGGKKTPGPDAALLLVALTALAALVRRRDPR